MFTKTICLENEYNLKNHATLEAISIRDNDQEILTKPTVIIVPGGGYEFVSLREADPVALKFLLKGYNCFVLTYSVTSTGLKAPLYPLPQTELMAAFDYVYKNAEEYHVDKNNIFLIGFSAGAHLVGSYSYLYKDKNILDSLDISDSSHLKPKGICLSYPVITMTVLTHGGSMMNLTDKNPELIEKLSIEKHISKDYPPTFIWHTEDDGCVPYENTKMMVSELSKNKVYHKQYGPLFGYHGMSIATELVCEKKYSEIAGWFDECDKFFKELISQ